MAKAAPSVSSLYITSIRCFFIFYLLLVRSSIIGELLLRKICDDEVVLVRTLRFHSFHERVYRARETSASHAYPNFQIEEVHLRSAPRSRTHIRYERVSCFRFPNPLELAPLSEAADGRIITRWALLYSVYYGERVEVFLCVLSHVVVLLLSVLLALHSDDIPDVTHKRHLPLCRPLLEVHAQAHSEVRRPYVGRKFLCV